jgi:hypothetical protein
MGLLDQLKKVAGDVKHKADDLAEKHGDSIKGGIDKAAGLAEKRLPKSKRKVVGGVAAKAKGLVDDLAQPESGDQSGDQPRPTDAAATAAPTAPEAAADPAVDGTASTASDES